jgi:hypothetical protein
MYGIDMGLDGSDCDLRGIHIAKVISNADGAARFRVYVRVYGIHDMSPERDSDLDYGIWAEYCSPTKSGGALPAKDDHLYVMFPDTSNPNRCIWMGWVLHNG